MKTVLINIGNESLLYKTTIRETTVLESISIIWKEVYPSLRWTYGGILSTLIPIFTIVFLSYTCLLLNYSIFVSIFAFRVCYISSVPSCHIAQIWVGQMHVCLFTIATLSTNRQNLSVLLISYYLPLMWNNFCGTPQCKITFYNFLKTLLYPNIIYILTAKKNSPLRKTV